MGKINQFILKRTALPCPALELRKTNDVRSMMIGKSSSRPRPTVIIPNWDPPNDPADNFPYVTYNCNAPCSRCPVDYLATLHRYLPSNDLEPDVLSDDSDVPVVDAFSCDHCRMYEFKVRRCARARSHDWTDCPYAHPGEKARRRDPRKFYYTGSSCPDFRKGNCKRGDSCEFAHGVFECWLHPTRYRTQPCKDGTGCKRRVCFFAHTPEQLRVLPQHSLRENGSGSGSGDVGYFGSSIRYRLDYVSSPTSILASPPFSPPSESPPMSPSDSSVSELTSSIRNLQLGKAKMGIPIGSCFVSHRSSILRPGSGSPFTPTRTQTRPGLSNAFEEEPSMERVESGRDLRARMYAKLSKDNSLDPLDLTGSCPDIGWVSEMVGY